MHNESQRSDAIKDLRHGEEKLRGFAKLMAVFEERESSNSPHDECPVELGIGSGITERQRFGGLKCLIRVPGRTITKST